MLLREHLLKWVAAAVLIPLVCTAAPSSARAQGIENVLHSSARMFPEIGADVRVIKRDSAGRYYIIAKPPSVIWVYSATGQRLGQIPNSHSGAATIRYAVDLDLDSDGNLYVADRGSNAVDVFRPDGSLASRVPVQAPMSVVALPEGQFAVVTLHSESLVTIHDKKGREVDDFGNPQELGLSSTPQSLLDIGKIYGSPAGYIYFAFISAPDPTIRKFDRGGYVVYTTSLPARDFELALPSSSADDRIQFGFNMMQMNFSDQVNAWTAVGTSGDVRFGSGVGTGLGARMRGGPLGPGGGGFGGPPSGGGFGGPGPGGPGPMGLFNDDNGAGGSPGMNGASVFGQGAFEHGQLHFNMGANLTNARRFNRAPGASGAPNTNTNGNNPAGGNGSPPANGPDDQQSASGDILQYNPPQLADDSGSAEETGTLSMSADNSLSSEELGMIPPAANTQLGTMFAGMGFQPGMFVGGQGFEPRRFFRPLGAGGPPGGPPPGRFGGFGGPPRPGFGANGANGFHFGPPGRFGFGMYNVEASVRINLDRPKPQTNEKPTISAIAVDPLTGEVWAGIGNALVHLDGNGNEVATYYVATPEGRPLHPSAILVEKDRVLIADDPLGIFSFVLPEPAPKANRKQPQSAITAQPSPPAATPE